MSAIHVNEAEAGIIRAALAEYARSIREQARASIAEVIRRAPIELHVLRLNVECSIEAVERRSAGDRVTPIDAWREARLVRRSKGRVVDSLTTP